MVDGALLASQRPSGVPGGHAQERDTWQASTISPPSGALSGFGGWWPSSGGAMAVSGSLLVVSTGQADHRSSVYVYAVP